MIIFAHNGIEHANNVEAATHSSGNMLVFAVGAAVVVIGAILYSYRKTKDSSLDEDEE